MMEVIIEENETLLECERPEVDKAFRNKALKILKDGGFDVRHLRRLKNQYASKPIPELKPDLKEGQVYSCCFGCEEPVIPELYDHVSHECKHNDRVIFQIISKEWQSHCCKADFWIWDENKNEEVKWE